MEFDALDKMMLWECPTSRTVLQSSSYSPAFFLLSKLEGKVECLTGLCLPLSQTGFWKQDRGFKACFELANHSTLNALHLNYHIQTSVQMSYFSMSLSLNDQNKRTILPITWLFFFFLNTYRYLKLNSEERIIVRLSMRWMTAGLLFINMMPQHHDQRSSYQRIIWLS